MTLDQARKNVMPFGKHTGKTLGDIEEDDLLYLDWLNGTEIRATWLAEAVALICEARATDIQSRVDEGD